MPTSLHHFSKFRIFSSSCIRLRGLILFLGLPTSRFPPELDLFNTLRSRLDISLTRGHEHVQI